MSIGQGANLKFNGQRSVCHQIYTLGVETFAWRNFRGKRNARNFVHFAWINFRGWTQ